MGMFLKTKRGVSALSTPIRLKQPFRSGVSIRNALRIGKVWPPGCTFFNNK